MVRASAKLKPHVCGDGGGGGADADAVLHAVEKREARSAPSDDRWPLLDRSIIQGFALDDVDGLPGCSSFVLLKARPGALMRQLWK